MLEREIEKYLVYKISKLGGKAYKFSSPSNRAVPDRLCVIPGDIFFVELKATGKVPTPLQGKIHKTLRGLRAEVFVVDSKEQVDIIYNIKREDANENCKNY